MPTYRVTLTTGEHEDHVFDGTIQQFVQTHWSGKGVPDGQRVQQIPDFMSTPIEVSKPAVRKTTTRKKGD